MRVSVLILYLLLSGCTGAWYSDERRTLGLVRLGYDTKVGTVEVRTPEGGTLTVENLDSQAKAAAILGKAIDRIPVP